MQNLTSVGQNIVNDVASRYQLSHDAVLHMLIAVNNGGGTMAQFNSQELGGSGQWMQGGMTMVGDMFNNGLQSKVDMLCSELSNALANNQMFPVIPANKANSPQWWPTDLGSPFSSGAQNNLKYAIFPQRLAIQQDGNIIIYDTLDHQISGVSQQQGTDNSLSFNSQYGSISANSLPVVSGGNTPSDSQPLPQNNFASSAIGNNEGQQKSAPNTEVSAMPGNETIQSGNNQLDIIQLLEKLGHLRDAGVITPEDFESKKTELLARI